MPTTGRTVSAVVLLVIGAGLALLAVLVHHSFMAMYGDVTGSAFDGFIWGLTSGPSGLALGVVAVVALIGMMLSPRLWMRLTAVAIPVLMLLVMLAVTPLALAQKTEKFDSAPQCVIKGTDEHMTTADRESQQAFAVMPCPGVGALWTGSDDDPTGCSGGLCSSQQ